MLHTYLKSSTYFKYYFKYAEDGLGQAEKKQAMQNSNMDLVMFRAKNDWRMVGVKWQCSAITVLVYFFFN